MSSIPKQRSRLDLIDAGEERRASVGHTAEPARVVTDRAARCVCAGHIHRDLLVPDRDSIGGSSDQVHRFHLPLRDRGREPGRLRKTWSGLDSCLRPWRSRGPWGYAPAAGRTQRSRGPRLQKTLPI